MKGLDDWIMGIHDPNAPFNQVDWVDVFDGLLQYCSWLTDEMIEKHYDELGEIFYKFQQDNFPDLPKRYWGEWFSYNAEPYSMELEAIYNKMKEDEKI